MSSQNSSYTRSDLFSEIFGARRPDETSPPHHIKSPTSNYDSQSAQNSCYTAPSPTKSYHQSSPQNHQQQNLQNINGPSHRISVPSQQPAQGQQAQYHNQLHYQQQQQQQQKRMQQHVPYPPPFQHASPQQYEIYQTQEAIYQQQQLSQQQQQSPHSPIYQQKQAQIYPNQHRMSQQVVTQFQPPPTPRQALRERASDPNLNQNGYNRIHSIPEQGALAPALDVRPISDDMSAFQQQQRPRPHAIAIAEHQNIPPQRPQMSPTTSKQQRSPIIQQGMNLFGRGGNSMRNISSPSLHMNNGSFSSSQYQSQTQPSSPGRTMSLTSFKSMGSFDNLRNITPGGGPGSNYNPREQYKKTSSGRIIPQKYDTGGASGMGGKTRSLSSISKTKRTSSSSLSNQRIPSHNSMSSRTMITATTRPPKVYPAMLSRVATLFKRVVVLTQHNKDGLEYRDSFTGSEAVDAISYIIRTTDRNLALLLGRALDAQKFFHDVTYEHRLRDSSNEVYQFDEVYVNANETHHPHHNDRNNSLSSDVATIHSSAELNTSNNNSKTIEVNHKVNGVFTLLTECYSPTCTKEALCYSISCPRRLEQQARLNMKPQGGLKRSESHTSLYEEEEKKQLWSHTVSKELLQTLDKDEIKRQELIYEVINTERTFIRNLEYLRDFWIRPLRESSIIPFNEREKFIRTVFFNVIDILNVCSRFKDALVRRQQVKQVVENIGDIFLEFIPMFDPFIKYNAGQCFAKHELERQKSSNRLFKQFIEETERLPESNRLNISSYLSQATTRTVRYNLLLRDIIKATREDSIDLPDLKKASEMIQNLLERINVKVGQAEDRHALILLKQRLVFRPGEYVDLKLSAENRKIVYTAQLKKRNQDKDNQGDIQVYLLDHVLLFVRVKITNKREHHKVFQRPIPLPLLFTSATEEMPNLRSHMRKLGAYAHVLNRPTNPEATKFPISFSYVARRGYDLTLYGSTNSAQDSLVSIIEQQQTKFREQYEIFTLNALGDKPFDKQNKINCLVPYDAGRKFLYGTDSGVFMSDVRKINGERDVSKPYKVIARLNVTQLEVMEQHQTLLALADKKLYAWPLEILTSNEKKIGKEIMSHVLFFKCGVCNGKKLVCAAKSDTIKVFEVSDPLSKKMSKKKFKNDAREFIIHSEPVSISFLKARLIVGCTKGFEIVSLPQFKSEPILDPADTSLDFITNKESLRPLAIYRISTNFLLSYSDFSFYINKNGWRTRPELMINWEGVPTSFSLWYPYLLAFEPNFIEIRHVETGELLRVILGENIRLLHMWSDGIIYACEDRQGYDAVASLDFWDKPSKSDDKNKRLSKIEEEKEK